MANNCADCQKTGLVIFPARYTVLLKQSVAIPSADYIGAPALNTNKLQYIRRVLRGGYLYVYNEAKAEWYSYVVSENGFFESIPNPVMPTSAGHNAAKIPTVDKLCFMQPMHKERSSFIKIKDYETLTNIWLSYSEAAWTADVFAAHQKPAVRTAHMRKINAKAASGTHVSKIDQIEQKVVEYHPSGARHTAIPDFKNRANQLKTLKQAATQSSIEPPKAPAPQIIVALDDPTGLIADIHSCMKMLNVAIHSIALQDRVYATDFKINMIRSNVEKSVEQTIDGNYADIESQASLEKRNPYMQARMGGLANYSQEISDKNLNAQQSYAKAWQKYSSKYDETQRQQFIKPVKQAFEKSASEQIDPMGNLSVTWQKHDLTKKHLTYNYDRKNVQNGLAYTCTINTMLAVGMEFKVCRDFALQQFESTVLKDNYVIQAFMLNQTSVEKLVSDTVSSGVAFNGLPWDAVFDAFQKRIAEIQAVQDVLNLWTQTSISFVSKHLLTRAGKAGLLPGLVSFATYNRTPLELVTVRGSWVDIQAEFTRAGLTAQFKMEANLPANMRPKSRGSVQSRIKWRIKELKRVHAARTAITQMEVIAIHRSPFTPVAQNARSVLQNRVYLPEQIKDLRYADWIEYRNVAVNNATQKLTGALKYCPPILAGSVMLMLQTVALSKANNDMPFTPSGSEQEAKMRRLATWLAMFGSGMGMIEGVLSKRIAVLGGSLASIGLKAAKYTALAGATIAGVAAGAIMAVFDAKNAFSEFDEGNGGVAGLYAASAILGLTLTALSVVSAFNAGLILFGLTLPVIGLILVGLVLIIAIAIEYFKDNPLQNWLERCMWGKLPKERYPGLKMDDAEFKKAIQA